MKTRDDFVAGFSGEEPGYLDYAHVGPLSVTAREERQVVEQALGHVRFGTVDRLRDEDERFRRVVSALTGFPPDQVSFQPNTSTGLMHVTFGLTGGEVLLSSHEFPSLTYAAVRASQALHVIEPAWLSDGSGWVTPSIIREHLTSTTSAVLVSLVDSRTGYVVDLDGIRQVIGDRLLIVDAIQGFGVVDAPYELADVVVSGGQKWVRSGWGTGFLAVSDRACEHLTPVFSGWTGASASGSPTWDSVDEPLRDARAFTVSHPDIVAQAGLAGALEEIAEVGVSTISTALAAGVDRVMALADAFGIPVSSPRALTERAGIVVFDLEPERVSALAASFFNHGVTATIRPTGVRLSVHAGTNDETFDMLRAALIAFTAL